MQHRHLTLEFSGARSASAGMSGYTLLAYKPARDCKYQRQNCGNESELCGMTSHKAIGLRDHKDGRRKQKILKHVEDGKNGHDYYPRRQSRFGYMSTFGRRQYCDGGNIDEQE